MTNVPSKTSAAAKLRRLGKASPPRTRRLRSASPGRAISTEQLHMGAKESSALRKPGKGRRASDDTRMIVYKSKDGVDAYVRQIAGATPMQIVEIERTGVPGFFIKDLSKHMEIPASRMFRLLGVPKATAEKKAAAGDMVAGRGGQAAIGMVRLLGIAQRIVANSTATEARNFDAAKWLGLWIERPQFSLGGLKPADLLDTPTGVEVVARLLGSIESGAYQ